MEEKRDISTLVRLISEHSRQGPGGQLNPHFHSLPYCILCNLGGVCLGICCQGQKKSKPRKQTTGASQVPGVPPGLMFVNRLANAPSRTTRRKLRLRKMESYTPNSDIYKWYSKVPSSPAKSSTKEDDIPSKRVPAKVSLVKNVCSFKPQGQRKDLKWLQDFLLKCGQQKKRKNKESKSFPSKSSPSKSSPPNSSPPKSSPLKSSLERKLEVSEISCERKPPHSYATKPTKRLPSSQNQSDRNLKVKLHETSQNRFVHFIHGIVHFIHF